MARAGAAGSSGAHWAVLPARARARRRRNQSFRRGARARGAAARIAHGEGARMTAFWIISALLGTGAVLFVVWPLLANRRRVRVSRSATNLSIYRDQLRELDADRDAGRLDAEHYEKARRELEARVLEEVQDDAAPEPARSGRARG